MSTLLEPLGFEFFRQALWAALLSGGLCGLLGVYVVTRSLGYIGHGLSHAAFGGAVVGALLKTNYQLTALLGALIAALAIDRLADGRRIKADTAIGLITTALFALGVALISLVGDLRLSFEAALFGNILGVSRQDLVLLSVVALLCVLVIGALYRPLLFVSFDEASAAVAGLPVRRLRLLFMLLLALCVIASLSLVGVTMLAATLIVPAASMRLLTDDFNRLVLLSPLTGMLLAVSGLFLSYYLDTPSGATIVLTGTLWFGGCLGWRELRQRHHVHQHAHRHGRLVHSHPHTHTGEHAHHHTASEDEQGPGQPRC